FDIGSPPARAGVREERHLARVLHRGRDELLLLDGHAGDATRTDLAALRDELPEGRDVLVVDDADAHRLRGRGVLAALARALAAVSAAAALACHCWVSCLFRTLLRTGSRRCSRPACS